jgi:hypothetical protein
VASSYWSFMASVTVMGPEAVVVITGAVAAVAPVYR